MSEHLGIRGVKFKPVAKLPNPKGANYDVKFLHANNLRTTSPASVWVESMSHPQSVGWWRGLLQRAGVVEVKMYKWIRFVVKPDHPWGRGDMRNELHRGGWMLVGKDI